ncbi:glucose-6-phosphate dehydrogenase [Caulobacter sp. RL271]|uniref:Glucose-6-phosphate 1-dehydrogenase n=1 Tax=Caulobacter segnis TaxID=88688 RepID=A0ABY4ZRN6_9CAUL|nr:glucose-6-phosphate dehydrogenase [Caulobacter segnis]USQ95371.1 glucose-6-phosphate dehydrogenase [Caulobacter segnis]
MTQRPPLAPDASLVIFGAMGDLARRLLAPSLANLRRDGLIGEGLSVIGVSHGEGNDEDLAKALGEFIPPDDAAAKSAWSALRGGITYLQGDFTEPATFQALADKLKGQANVVFYLATSPSFFAEIVEGLGHADLLDESEGFRRVVIEKPFGVDLESAKALNARLLKVATEEQLYRIDHFLGKDTVRNILVARFGNSLLEAVWNNRFIDHIQITAAETIGVGTRGKFYDATGALRDMVPNHLFKLLAMVGMEAPNSFDAEAVRAERARVIGAIRPPSPEDAKTNMARGRYTAGQAAGKPLKDYVAESDVAADGDTETYVALKLEVDTWRLASVPIYLRTGKAMSTHDTEIVIAFKPPALALFRESEGPTPANQLILQIGPDEGITLDFVAKAPGPLANTAPVSMAFRYKDHFEMGGSTGYETLIYDVLIGDPSLFQRGDEIEAAWRAVQPFLTLMAQGDAPLEDYAAGSDGPAGADALMARDGRQWHRLGS